MIPARRFSRRTWTLVLSAVVVIHYFLFAVVHNLVDMRPCTWHLPDPLYALIPLDPRWSLVTETMYGLAAVLILATLFHQAFRGDHFPVLRVGTAITIQSALRAATLLAFPACRITLALGSPGPLAPVSLASPRFYALGIRGLAVNDLIFSGHIGFFLIFLYATAAWPRPVRIALACFTLLMAYGLLSTREHYTLDLLVALPASYAADRLAVRFLTMRKP